MKPTPCRCREPTTTSSAPSHSVASSAAAAPSTSRPQTPAPRRRRARATAASSASAQARPRHAWMISRRTPRSSASLIAHLRAGSERAVPSIPSTMSGRVDGARWLGTTTTGQGSRARRYGPRSRHTWHACPRHRCSRSRGGLPTRPLQRRTRRGRPTIVRVLIEVEGCARASSSANSSIRPTSSSCCRAALVDMNAVLLLSLATAGGGRQPTRRSTTSRRAASSAAHRHAAAATSVPS